MKKSVLLLCIFLLIFSGWFSLKDFTRISIGKATTIAYYCDPQKNSSDNYQLQIAHNVDDIPAKEFHETFESLLIQNHLYSLKVVYTFENQTNRSLIQFSYSSNTPGIEKRMWLDNGVFDPTVIETYSTDKINKNTHIASFFLNDKIVEAFPLVLDESNGGMYNLLSTEGYEEYLKENIDQFISDLEKIYPEIKYGLSNYANAIIIGDPSEPSYLEEAIELTFLHFITALGIAGILSILLCSKFLSLRRKISIMKIEGMSTEKIFFQLYEKYYLLGGLACLILAGGFSFIYYKNNIYAFRVLWLVSTIEFLMFAGIQQILSFVLIPMISLMPIVSSEKGKNNLKSLFYLSLAIKLFAVILIVPRIVTAIPDIQSYFLMKSRYEKVDNSLKNSYFFNTRYASNYFNDFGSDSYNKVYESFTKNHLIRFNRDYLYENETEMIPCYVTKIEYIEDQGLIKDGIDYDNDIVIYLKEGQNYDLEKIKYFAQFKTFETSKIDFVYYSNLPKTYSLYELLYSDYTNGDPIVCVPEEIAVKGQIEGSCIYYEGTLDEVQKYVDGVFNENGYEAALRMGPSVKLYEQFYAYYSNIYTRNIIRLILMLIAYFLAHRLLVSTDMECNRTRYYLSKVEGVSPYPVCKYMIKVASPMIVGIILVCIKGLAETTVMNIIYTVLFLLIIELISYIWFKNKAKKIWRE